MPRGDGQKGRFLLRLFVLWTFFLLFFFPVCLFIVISLNAFDVALMFFSHGFFFFNQPLPTKALIVNGIALGGMIKVH